MARVGKRLCLEQESFEASCVENLKREFEVRFTALESKIDLVITACSTILMHCENLIHRHEDEHKSCSSILLPKMELLEDLLNKFWDDKSMKTTPTTATKPVVLVSTSSKDPILGEGSRNSETDDLQVITLNSEEDLPDGSWLGDEQRPEARVRVNIPPSILLHINEHCSTPEKMALTLMDCLFSREVQAVSNLSGKGKHCKRRLDPLLVYGIRCHLVHKFSITDKDWHRIKQNIDSKCRSIWRKKVRGLPLGLSKNSNNATLGPNLSEDSSDGSQVFNVDSPFKLVRSERSQKVLQLNDGKTIQVFTEDDFTELLPSSVELFSIEDSDCFGLGDQATLIIEKVGDGDDDIQSGGTSND